MRPAQLPSTSSNSSSSSLAQPIMGAEFDTLLRTLQDSTRRDDEKLKALQDLWSSFEVFVASPIYSQSLENLIRVCLRILTETVPQFITDHKTHLLRKQILEIMLRTSTNEAMKTLIKEITKTLLRLLTVDNEDNAILAVKVLIDVWKSAKMQFLPEVTTAAQFCKQIVKEMSHHVNNGMFETKEFGAGARNLAGPNSDEALIENFLPNCFYAQPVTHSRNTGQEPIKYTIIPRAQQSVKLIQEMTMFFVFIYQHLKTSMLQECIEFLVMCLEFVCLQIPQEVKDSPNFNRALADEFYTSQSKNLCFISIMGKVPQFMEVILKNASALINAILGLLETIPHEMVVVRKEVLMTLKFCCTTDLKNHMLRFLTRFLDEKVLLGTGFTSCDHLRTFIYQMLADLLHHMRGQLNFPMVLQTSAVFCRTMNDPHITYQVQVMCIRLLSSVCEVLSKMEKQGDPTRDLLIQILDNLVYKLKRIATYHLPALVKVHGYEDLRDKKDSSPLESGSRSDVFDEVARKGVFGFSPSPSASAEEESSRSEAPHLPPPVKTGKAASPEQIYTNLMAVNSPAMTVIEARNMVKYILLTVKVVCSQLENTRRTTNSISMEKEREFFENLLKYGIVVMDVYLLPYASSRGNTPPNIPSQRTKEEKEIIDSFAQVFTYMDPEIYREIFSKQMPLLIERINTNPTLQLFANAFLVRADWVCKFGSIMLKHLMDNMHVLAVSNEKTALYVKLFKILFSAIGAGQQATTEGELMLKPYLGDLIRKSTEFALTAREPLNYFLLLRALFRSIGGGAHDILYSNFLPLLPNLLLFLNKLQSCNHRQQMRELFLELCLTVPVRLSSLLPYLPLLMDPLVCALTGSASLVQQGLRTLELCVDNLQPEYLFENMAPVRSALIQGLWRVLSTSVDPASAQTAFRILGKFGGASRRIMNKPQMLTAQPDSDWATTMIRLEFARDQPLAASVPIMFADLALGEIMALACEQMKLCTTSDPTSNMTLNSLLPVQFVSQTTPQTAIIRENCMALAKAVFLASLCPNMGDDWQSNVLDGLKDNLKRLEQGHSGMLLFKCPRESDRKMYINALVTIMMGVMGKDLRASYVGFFTGIVRQLTVSALLESTASDHLLTHPYIPLCLDGSILVEAITTVLSDSNKDFLSSAIVALCHINETCETLCPPGGSFHKTPLIRNLLESVSTLCYGPSWFSRLGGASALSYIIRNYPMILIRHNLSRILECLCEVIVGLVDEISSGAVDIAVSSLSALQKRVLENGSDSDATVIVFLNVYLPFTLHTSSFVRERAWELLYGLAECAGTPLRTLLSKEGIKERIAAKIDQIITQVHAMSMCEQSSSLAALLRILEEAPSLVDISLSDPKFEHFFEKVLDLCDNDVPSLLSRDFYKSTETCPVHFLPPFPIPHQMEAMRAVAIQTLVVCLKVRSSDDMAMHEDSEKVNEFAQRIYRVALRSALFGSEKLQEAVTSVLIKCSPLPVDLIREVAGSVLENVQQPGGCNSADVVKLEKIIKLNPELFTKEITIRLVEQIERWQLASEGGGPQQRSPEDVDGVKSLVRLILASEFADAQLARKIVSFVAFFESTYTTDTDYNWIPLVCEMFARWPAEMVAMVLSIGFMKTYHSLIRRVLEDEKGAPLRKKLIADPAYFENLIQLNSLENGTWVKVPFADDDHLIEYEEIIFNLLDGVAEREPEWFQEAHALAEELRKIWQSEAFVTRYAFDLQYVEEPDGRKMVRVMSLPTSKANVPALLITSLTRYYKKNHENFELLFEMMSAFNNTFITDFGFLREFLENEVIPKYSIPWRRRLFELVLEKLEKEAPTWGKTQTLSRIVQYLLIPSLQWAFERYEVEEILGPALSPNDQQDEDPNSLVSRLTVILEKHRQGFSEHNTIAFYQLCTVLVEHAADHIHNNACKKQGGRLRIFMLFVWAVLTPTTKMDPTLRYQGFHFLAHIIDRFTINRKIVIQVFTTLSTSYQLDNRELVKKAVDVLTPAVPIRMDDGHQQMLAAVKKVLIEEAHNLPQIQHIVHMVIRNYRVYFYVRHDLISPLLTAIQRILHSVNGVVEGFTARKLTIEVCEMAIKWDLLRNQMIEKHGKSDGVEVESMLETLKELEQKEKDPAVSNGGSTGTSRAEQSVVAMNAIRDENIMRPLGKDYVDQIVNILLKFACMVPVQNQPAQYASSTVDMAKRSLGLLRAALKPVVWGDTVTIRNAWIEKQLTIPQDFSNLRNEGQMQATQHMHQAHQTLDVLLTLSPIMSKTLLLNIMRPLQRPLISCLNTSNAPLIRVVNYMVARLFEKTKASGNGLEELEIFNQYIGKFLNEHFMNYVKSSTGYVTQIFTPFSLLRSICNHMPAYLDGSCLPNFLKVLEKVVRDHQTQPLDHQREKTAADFLSVALDLVRQRVDHISNDVRRTICQSILLPLIEKASYDKIIDSLLKITHAIVVSHNDKYAANPGLPLSMRLHILMERKLRSKEHSSPLLASYLTLVLVIFDNPTLRSTDFAERMEDAFYWGLMSPDTDTREKFLAVWERSTEPFVFKRLMFVLQKENWSHFGKYYWIRHALWLCLRCCLNRTDFPGRRAVYFSDCATLWRTLEITSLGVPSLGASTMNSAVISEGSTPSRMEGEPMEVDNDRFDQLVASQRALLAEAQEFDSTSVIRNIIGIMFNVNDTKFVSTMWSRFFNSLWTHMLPEERDICGPAIEPFLSSGVHKKQMNAPHSALSTWLETLNHMVPSIHLPPRLVNFIASNHMAWHRGILMLESQVLMLNGGRMLNNDSAAQVKVDAHTQIHLDTLDYLAYLYKDLDELDQFSAIWDRRAIKPETLVVMNHMQKGDWKEALHSVEDALINYGEQVAIAGSDNRIGPALDQELDHLFEAYSTCCEELLEWEKLRDYGNSSSVQSQRLLLKAAVHLPDWDMVKECRNQMAGCVPPKFTNQYNIINLMLMIMQPRDLNDPLSLTSKARMDKAVEEMVMSHVSAWRTLPSIISHCHVKILQSMSLIREVADCVELKAALDSNPREFSQNILNDMKQLIKTWRNRICTNSDDLSFLAAVTDWRCQMHSLILKRFEEWDKSGVTLPPGTSAQSILPVHSAAQGQMAVAKAARNMRLYDLAIDQLNRLHTMPAVPLMDAHLKICEHLKVIKLQAEAPGVDAKRRQDLYTLGVHLVNETHIADFGRDQVSKLYCQKGIMLGALDKREEAGKAFSLATQAMEQGPGQMPAPPQATATSAFKAWGNHMDRLLHNDSNELSGITSGAGAIACFLEVARSSETEHKPKKYIGKLLWTAKHMVSVGDGSCKRLDEQIEKHERSTVPFNWLYWIPQLINDIRCRPESAMTKILARITEDYPLQVFYALRGEVGPAVTSAIVNEVCMGGEALNLDSVEPWVRQVVPVLRTACKLRSADVRVFHTLLLEIYNMREFWAERVFRFGNQLKKEIARCLSSQRHLPIGEIHLDAEAMQIWEMWKRDVLEELPRISFLREAELSYLANEERPTEDKSEEKFIAEILPEIVNFLVTPAPPGQLVTALSQLTLICNRLYGRLIRLPRRIPLKLSSQYLADFSHRLACIEMPSDLLDVHKANATHLVAGSRSGQYVSMISRIDPYMAISFEGGEVVRRMHFRAHSGKSAGFYVRRTIKPKVGVSPCQQYLSSINHLLAKERETSRRHLSVYVPIQLDVGYGCTLTEVQGVVVGENPSGLANFSPICHPQELLAGALQPIGMQPDDALSLFYERIYDGGQAAASHEARLQVTREFGMEEFISPSILLRYLGRNYTDPTMFYMLRKQIARHLAVLNTLEWTVKLSPVMVGDMYINRTTGQYTNPNYAFQPILNDNERPVPYRMTPNVACTLGFAQSGDYLWCADATVRCLFYRHPETFLRPLLWDYYAQVLPKTASPRDIWMNTNNQINHIIQRIRDVSVAPPNGQHVDSAALLQMAQHDERLCEMDPAQYPWF